MLSHTPNSDVPLVGHIQSSGCLLAGSRETGLITHMSENFLRLASNSEWASDLPSVFGTEGSLWLGSAWSEALLVTLDLRSEHVILLRKDGRLDPDWWECFAYSSNDHIVFQFRELVRGTSRRSFNDLDTQLHRLRLATTTQDLWELASKGIQATCKFDAVEVVRFRSDGESERIAIATRSDSHLQQSKPQGVFLSKPAPAVAQTFYGKERFRFVADSHSKPVEVLAAEGESALDLSSAYLRGVSEVHCSYLQAMNVHSAMSIAIRHDGRLWGQIVGYTYTPHFSFGRGWYEVRGLSNLYGDALESCLSNITSRQAAERIEKLGEGVATSVERTRHLGLIDDVLKAWLLSAAEILAFPYIGFIDERASLLVHDGEVYPSDHEWKAVVERLFYISYSVSQDPVVSRLDLLEDPEWLEVCPVGLDGMAGIHIAQSSERNSLLVIVGLGAEEDGNQPQHWDYEEAARFEEFSNALVSWLEIYENTQLRQELRRYYYKNLTTGLHNRRFFRDYLGGQLPIELRDIHKGRHSVAFLILDIQNFKLFNQRQGNSAGDRYLQSLADVLRQVFPSTALIMHFDSDNFAILLAGSGLDKAVDAQETEVLIEAFIDASANLAGESSPTIVIGAVLCRPEALSYSELVIAADSQLRTAEHAGLGYSLDWGAG